MFFQRKLITRCRYVNIMIQAVVEASHVLVKNFSQMNIVNNREKFLLSTEQRIVSIISSMLYEKYEYPMLYEGGENTNSSTNWILDPIDGSRNFTSSIPLFCINLALRKENEIVAGVIYDPIRDDIYWGSKGLGAHINNSRISLSKESNIVVSKIGMKLDRSIRNLGSTGLELAYVASGKYAAFVAIKPNIWDVAPGLVLINECYGYISHTEEYLLCGEKNYCKSLADFIVSSNNLQA